MDPAPPSDGVPCPTIGRGTLPHHRAGGLWVSPHWRGRLGPEDAPRRPLLSLCNPAYWRQGYIPAPQANGVRGRDIYLHHTPMV
eukprot:7446084-Pyramimonas_sp.AAC.2